LYFPFPSQKLNLISALFKHYELNQTLSLEIIIYYAELTYFLLEYLYFEEVHLYTYDLIDENIGFKLTWGCLCFYGFFYPLGVRCLVPPGVTVPSPLLIASPFVFLTGYILTRGANLQKFYFKTRPNEPFLGIQQQALGNKILCSGFWGLSRHINYLGEILLATGIALATGTNSIFPWLYPLYYLLLLFPRERDDHERCLKKYGELWRQYCRLVPYRIIPFVY